MSRPDSEMQLFIISHYYNPNREDPKVSEVERKLRGQVITPGKLNIVKGINFDIHDYCYDPVLVDPPAIEGIGKPRSFPLGTVSSFVGPLREWMKTYKPDDFKKVRANINYWGDDQPFRMVADPYIHAIMPLQSPEDQDMLVKIGRQAFIDDMGFIPKGFWLPETAVTKETLRILHRNGYDYVALRDSQLKNSARNPMFVPLEEDGEIAVIHGDTDLSGSVSFNKEFTAKAEDFLHSPKVQEQRQKHNRVVGIISDGELWGWHQEFKDQFYYCVTNPDFLQPHGFRPFDLREALSSSYRPKTEVVDDSSWSCGHKLGRWKGSSQCDCSVETYGASPDPRDVLIKSHIYRRLTEQRSFLNASLDRALPDWRVRYVDFFLETRRAMFGEGDLAAEVSRLQRKKSMEFLSDSGTRVLFLARLASDRANASCWGFFEGIDRPERAIATGHISEVSKILRLPAQPVENTEFAA